MGKKKRLKHFGRRIQVCDIDLTNKLRLNVCHGTCDFRLSSSSLCSYT